MQPCARKFVFNYNLCLLHFHNAFQEFEKDETFKIDLIEIVTPGAKLGRIKKSIITIVNDDGNIFQSICFIEFNFQA